MSGALPIIRVVASAIDREKVKINDLNLFPVPDGDTGTNLALTLTNMASDITLVPKKATPKEMINAIARSANNRARGNSGTILAGIISGMAEHLQDAEELTPELLAGALEHANEKAREVVSKPAEGTMLTVIKDMAVAARKAVDEGAVTMSDLKKPILLAAMQATDESAEIMRNILNKKNVGKDAGAFGLTIMVYEALRYVADEIDDIIPEAWGDTVTSAAAFDAPFPEDEVWEPGTPLYCTEFVLHFSSDFPDIKPRIHLEALSAFGNSEIFTVFENIAKAHVHTDTPLLVFEHFAQFGEFAFIKAENMRMQAEAQSTAKYQSEPKKPLGIVAVASGEGAKKLLLDAGADIIVDGGQTNNPEVGEIREAIIDVHAEVVVVLPGNKNIISAAQKACQMAKEESGTIGITIPTSNLPQNIAALVAMPENLDLSIYTDGLLEELTQAAGNVRTASITTAVKDYETDAVSAVAGQFISIIDDKITFTHENFLEIIKISLKELLHENATIVTVYVGEGCSVPRKSIEKVLAKVAKKLECEVIFTDQPVYHYIAVE